MEQTIFNIEKSLSLKLLHQGMDGCGLSLLFFVVDLNNIINFDLKKNVTGHFSMFCQCQSITN